MSRQGDAYQLDWRVGSSSFRGTGTPQGNILSVDWGQSTPVVYAVGADGTLKGLWSAGQGEETLVPDREVQRLRSNRSYIAHGRLHPQTLP